MSDMSEGRVYTERHDHVLWLEAEQTFGLWIGLRG